MAIESLVRKVNVLRVNNIPFSTITMERFLCFFMFYVTPNAGEIAMSKNFPRCECTSPTYQVTS
jgi:hypothetical protein